MLKPNASEYGSKEKWNPAQHASGESLGACSAEGHGVGCNLFIDNPTMVQWTSKHHKSNESFPFLK